MKKNCEHCGIEFITFPNRVKKGNGRYCSKQCHEAVRQKAIDSRVQSCIICGSLFKPRQVQLTNGQGKYCSNACRIVAQKSDDRLELGFKNVPATKEIREKAEQTKRERGINRKENHPFWKGGRFIGSLGYVLVRVETGKYEQEHRIVMEKHLGRKLSPEEIIHHENHVKHDNRLENLKIVTRAEHINMHRDDLVQAIGITGDSCTGMSGNG